MNETTSTPDFNVFNPDDMAKLWKEQQHRIEQQKIVNRELLVASLHSKSHPLAPKTVPGIIFFSIMFVMTGLYTVMVQPLYWPVPLLCLYVIPDILWQNRMRGKIDRMEGGLAGMQRNLVKYKKGFRNLSVAMWCLLIPYIGWFVYFMHKNMEMDLTTVAIIASIMTGTSIGAFVWRLRYTNRGIREIEAVGDKLAELDD